MTTKSIFFSNFKYDYTNKNEKNNELSIDEISNLNTNNGFIQSELSISDILFELFDSEIANLIKTNNIETLSKIIKIIPYEFIDETNNLKTLRLFAISEEYILFELNYENYLLEQKYIFTGYQKDVLSKNILYIFDLENRCIVIENNNILAIENIPTIDSFVFNEGILYFSVQDNQSKLYVAETEYLKDISINLEQYTTIDIPIEDGLICKIVNIKNQVYAITQYSILKINKEELLLQKQNNVNTFIFNNSVNQLDDSVVFFSENGLYVFDGTDLKLIFDNSFKITKNAIFVIFNNNLYILSENFKNIILKYNFNENEFSYLKLNNLKYLYIIKTYSQHHICAGYINNDSLSIASLYGNKTINQLSQFVKFKPIFLNNNKLKQIQSINFNATGNFELNLESNISTSNFNITNSTNLSNLSFDGNYFIFTISSESEFKINSIMLTYNEIGE